jgi:Tfp pilus assembly protein PilN
MSEATAEAKSPNNPARQLVLHTMLSLLVSVAVFVVVSWMVIVPQLARHEVRIRALESQLAEMQEAEEVAAAATAPATAAPAPAVPSAAK